MNSKLSEIISGSDNIVFFGGAGVSTESGIPDFRSADGIYNMKYKYPPEQILSLSFFKRKPDAFYEFYREKLMYPDILPNKAHYALARLEKQGKLQAIVTQNVDGLHHMAGSSKVLELHGSGTRYYCMNCNEKYPPEFILNSTGIPLCDCGGIVRPDVVLFEEMLDMNIVNKAKNAINNAEVLIVGGTSLNVYPAAGLVDFYKGDKLVLINKTGTPYDRFANLVIRENIGETLENAIPV
jgi:NAD-dependent deacetylase